MNRPADLQAAYNGQIGIEIGGAYSSTFLQKPYEIETRDETGNNRNASLLGIPSENDWVLTTNYNDKSFMRTSLAFDLFRRMGHYAPRAKLCEVIVNSKYRGVYILSETIKQDKNRVDISFHQPPDRPVFRASHEPFGSDPYWELHRFGDRT
jgi:hypothetical protein